MYGLLDEDGNPIGFGDAPPVPPDNDGDDGRPLDSRRFDGTTLRRCSHSVPYEEACPACVEEALR